MYEDKEAGGESSRPMYDEEIHDDPSKLLAALAKVEKAEEARARLARQEREERKAARMEGAEGDGPGAGEEGARDGGAEGSAGGGGGEGGEEGGKKKGAKKPGVAATARNMTEDKRLKLANKTAAAALGFGNTGKAWMFGGASASSSPSPAASSGKLNGSAGGQGPAEAEVRTGPRSAGLLLLVLELLQTRSRIHRLRVKLCQPWWMGRLGGSAASTGGKRAPGSRSRHSRRCPVRPRDGAGRRGGQGKRRVGPLQDEGAGQSSVSSAEKSAALLISHLDVKNALQNPLLLSHSFLRLSKGSSPSSLSMPLSDV